MITAKISFITKSIFFKKGVNNMILVSTELVTDKLINVEVFNEVYSIERTFKNKHLILKTLWISFLLILKIVFSPYKMDNRNGKM
jgi:hypothetical protein